MSRYNVEVDGKWACFSSVVNAFVTPFMEKEEYESWRREEYGRAYFKPAETCNRMTLAECLKAISLTRTDEEICQELLRVGLIYDRNWLEEEE